MESKKIISETQMDALVSRGILYKDSDDCYHPLIDWQKWGFQTIPHTMMLDVADKTIKLTKTLRNKTWRTKQGYYGRWFISPWMLEENYEELFKHGKYTPEPQTITARGGQLVGVYNLKIMDFEHLEMLVKKGVLSKKRVGSLYFYNSKVDDMGVFGMSSIMVDKLGGKEITCIGDGSSWYETDTECNYNIAQWMLADNYDYLLDRLTGLMNTSQFKTEKEPEKKPEKEKEPEKKSEDFNEVSVIGTIENTNSEYIILSCSSMTVPVLCYGDAGGHDKNERVQVRGTLRRVYNMMGYPEIDIIYIEGF